MAADNKPFIRFSHSKKLRTQTLKVLNAIDKAKDPVKFREPLAELVIDLTVAGLEQFFSGVGAPAEDGVHDGADGGLGRRACWR